MSARIWAWLYWRTFPGLNLHSRQRFDVIPRYFEASISDGKQKLVLDAGCGNGMLAYRRMNPETSVIGISIKESEVRKARRLFNEYLGISEARMRFDHKNLYELDYQKDIFDEIICSEVLEHLRDDSKVCASFFELLKPGGVAHICAPNAEHPYNESFPLDSGETGGHVRPGYTERTYRELLEPLGFTIEKRVGLGGPIRQAMNRRIKSIQTKFGSAAGIPLFILSLLALKFERADIDPPVPFSIYVRARKPAEVR